MVNSAHEIYVTSMLVKRIKMCAVKSDYLLNTPEYM